MPEPKVTAALASPTAMTAPTAPATPADTAEPTYTPLDDELSAAEQRVVDASVRWLHEAAIRHGIEHALEVRDHILTHYFDGDYDAFADPSRSKPRSLRALAARADLPYSFATLHRLVRVGQQVELLPPGLGRSLSLGHHQALLSVVDPELKATLAAEALEQRLTTAALEAQVRARKPPSKAGRPPLPPVVKQAHALRRAVVALALPAPEAVAALDDDDRADLAEAIAEARARLDALAAALGDA